MLASTLTAIPSFQVIFLRKNDEAFFTHVEIFRVKITSFPKSTQSFTHQLSSLIQVYNKKVQNKLKKEVDKSLSSFNIPFEKTSEIDVR